MAVSPQNEDAAVRVTELLDKLHRRVPAGEQLLA
jgi:hypothetical protein